MPTMRCIWPKLSIGRAVDADDHEVAGLEARALGGASGIDDVDLGRGAPLAE